MGFEEQWVFWGLRFTAWEARFCQRPLRGIPYSKSKGPYTKLYYEPNPFSPQSLNA